MLGLFLLLVGRWVWKSRGSGHRTEGVTPCKNPARFCGYVFKKLLQLSIRYFLFVGLLQANSNVPS